MIRQQTNKGAARSQKQFEFECRQQTILDSALSLFDGPHWEQVTVEQISKRAEIGKGTVYKHFRCKEEIYAYISIAFTKRILEAYHPVVRQKQVLDKLKEIIRISFELFLSNPKEARIAFYCKREDFRERLTPELQKAFGDLDAEFEEFIGAILQSGIAQGIFPNKPVEHLMMGVEATFDGAISMIWNGEIKRYYGDCLETYIDIISEFMLAGLSGQNK